MFKSTNLLILTHFNQKSISLENSERFPSCWRSLENADYPLSTPQKGVSRE